MKKKAAVTGILASALAVTALVGCAGTSDKENKEEVSQEQVQEQVTAQTTEEMMTKVKEQIAADFKAGGIEEEVLVDGVLQGYAEIDLLSDDEMGMSLLEKMGINKEDLEEGRALLPLMNVKSDQIIILKAKDADKVEALEQGLQLAKEDQIAAWSTYLPAQLEKVENNIIQTNDNFLMYVTYDTPEVIAEILTK